MRGIALDGVPDFTEKPAKKPAGSATARDAAKALRARAYRQKPNDPTRVTCGCGIAAEQHHLPVVARWHASWRQQA